MSGRIYDQGINPICDRCGSKMWTSAEMNFYGAKCKRKNCDGKPIYTLYDKVENKPKVKIDKNGKYILEGVFSNFVVKRGKYTYCERFRNFLFTLIHGY